MKFIYDLLHITFTFAAVDLSSAFPYAKKVPTLGSGVDLLVPTAFSIATVLVVFFFLFGGFKLLKSGGDEKEVAAAREMITHAVIGFVLLMAAFFVLQFALDFLFGITDLQIIKGL